MTLYAKISELEVRPGRQRREFKLEAINELGTSITNIGLLQAPVVRLENGKPILVAGERRVRAMSDLHDLGVIFNYGDQEVPHGMIPYVTLGSLDPLQAWEAELEENIRRVDLTWQERAAATAELLELRRAQAEEAGTALPTIASIAEELRPDESTARGTTTKEELIVSRFLKDPEIKAAPTMKEAVKILKKRDETARREILAEAVGRTFTASSHVLEQVDFLEWQATAKPVRGFWSRCFCSCPLLRGLL
jgi:ParB-like chromosome segregation protein Spo0J